MAERLLVFGDLFPQAFGMLDHFWLSVAAESVRLHS